MFYLIPLHWLPGLVIWKEIPKFHIPPTEYITEIKGYSDFKFPVDFFNGMKEQYGREDNLQGM